jgi:hypothetical protein
MFCVYLLKIVFLSTRSVTSIELFNFSEVPDDKVSHFQMSLAV